MNKIRNETILITGGAGFIGYHLSRYLLDKYPAIHVVTIDNMNNYYDLDLKRDRIAMMNEYSTSRYTFHHVDLNERDKIDNLFKENQFNIVVNLAAQAGVRYARENPESYIRSNIDGFFNILDLAQTHKVERVIYASSSSVYGTNEKIPFAEGDKCDTPMSLYAATKLSNEMIARSYYFSYGLQSIGLRFFNVYGPFGRPDMAYYKWSDLLMSGDDIELRNNGAMYRDMTYIDDVVVAIDKLMLDYELNDGAEIYNIGNEKPVKIDDLLYCLQEMLGKSQSRIVSTSRGSEEPLKTYADTDKLFKATGFRPNTDFREGIRKFVEWYVPYYEKRNIENK